MLLSKSRSLWTVIALTLLVAGWTSSARAGNGFFRNGGVGGVAIDTEGVVSQPTADATTALREAMIERLGQVPNGLEKPTRLRRISLRQLNDAIDDAIRNHQGQLPNEIRYLAGIQRVQFVFVYPEQNDIVLAGPGDSWTVDQFGNAVGKTNGRPMIQLDDLLVALRTVGQAREVGVSCSIDPTPEGILRMQSEMKKQKTFQPRVIDQIERALGPQQISLTGVPETSHFARVLVAADYRMKRIAMDLEQAPVKSLPSFLDMLANSRARLTNMMPRWWLACDYEPLARSDDGLAWELRGPGVQVMTEDDLVEQDGTRTESGRKSDIAVKWAETMNARYDELSVKQPIFGQLRNLMDLCVAAAVMEKHGLIERAGCDISLLTRSDSDLVLESWNAPRTVSTQCSFTKRGREYLITASGGVQIESWQVAEKSQVDAKVQRLRDEAAGAGNDKRWWN